MSPLPQRWVFGSPQDVAAELGEAGRWQLARVRFDVLVARFEPEARPPINDPGGETSAGEPASWPQTLSRSFDLLADLSEQDFTLLAKALDWLLRHPDSGLYLRQVPIAGIDSKWIEP